MKKRPLPLILSAFLAAHPATPSSAQDPFASGTVEVQSAESSKPVAPVPSPAPTPAKAPEPALIDSIKKAAFSRAPQTVLDETAATLLPPPPPPVVPPATTLPSGTPPPPPDPHAATVSALQRAVATGNWPGLAILFSEKFKDQPVPAREAWLHIVTGLSGNSQMPQMGGPREMGGGMGGGMEGNPQMAAFRQSQIIHPGDVLALADLCPGDLDQPALDKLSPLLRTARSRGERFEEMLALLEKGTPRLGGTDPAKRLLAAKLLLTADAAVEAGPFLTTLEEALAASDADRLNLLSRHFLGQQAKDGQPIWLERAWQATQAVLALPGAELAKRQEALRRAMDLAPRVQASLGEKWLVESFTTEPARGLEILAAIGNVISRDRMNFQAATRQSNLEMQHRVVTSLLQAAPDRAAGWRTPLTILALNWQAEAKWSQERDLSTQRGPQMQYDPFGNVFFSNYDPEQQMQMQRQQGPSPIPTGRLLELRPDDAWLDRMEPSLRPAVLAQTIELFLKVNEPEAAFPLIERISATLKDEGQRLAARFLDVWTEKKDPNSAKRRTNRYMYSYGYNPQADGIPLTRSQQDRNLLELAAWVKRLRALPVGTLDEAKIANAFVKTHSQAEVYRLEAMEKVFGPLEGMKPETLASLVQTMRTNLASVWRVPKVQQDAKTKRTDKDIQAEILRGYNTALEALEPALKAHPDHWALRLANAACVFDQATYENTLSKGSDFTAKRNAAFIEFQQAATLYAKALPSMLAKEQSAQVYQQWFYASLGACDLEGVKFEYPESPKQYPLIREAIASLTGEPSKKHLTEFANNFTTRLSAVQPELKHRYLGAGLQITGDHERAGPARDLFAYYKDLVTEVQLVARIDGPDEIGIAPFGVFIEIRHTGQIEREAGGFQKYLQNQQGGFYYNFGRPPENYREKFEEALRQALSESFDLLSCTFHSDKILSRGTDEEGWRVTPYAYLLLKPKGPQVDALPALKLNLDFLDTSGFAVLPIASNRLPLAANGSAAPRPVEKVEIKQVLDERKAAEGVLALEIRTSAHGLVPPLDQLVTFPAGDFELTATDDQGVIVTQLDGESEENAAISERLVNLTYRAKQGLPNPPKTFAFGAAVKPEYTVSHFRYADADLAAVGPVVDLLEKYTDRGVPWSWILGSLAALGLGAGYVIWRRNLKPVIPSAGKYTLPGDINPLTVLGLLRRIRDDGPLASTQAGELDETIAHLEDHYFGTTQTPVPVPDLDQTARRWVALAG